MNNPPEFGPNDAAVRTHLSILQDVIRRMAANSASCKNWCIVLVAAMLILTARTDTPAYALLAFFPVVFFAFLDAYYLALEQAFRHSYNDFVRKLHRGEVALTDLYRVVPTGRIPRQMGVSLRSTAVWPFYGMLAVAILLVWKIDGIRALLGW